MTRVGDSAPDSESWQSFRKERCMFIAKADLTNQKVFDIYQAAFMEPEMNDNGEVRLRVNGLAIWAEVSDKGFFVLKTGFPLKEEATREQAVDLANAINDGMVMVRCCVPAKAPAAFIWFDHWTMLEGGISAEEIVAATWRFVRVLADGVSGFDTEKIVA
jgi:hypothetical protein